MGAPVNFGSGVIPVIGDTRLMLLIKRLKVVQANQPSPKASNDPTTADTRRTLLKKIDASLAGV